MDSSNTTIFIPANVAVRDADKKSLDSYASNMDSSVDNNVDSSSSKQTRFKYEKIESKIIDICLMEYKSVAQIAEELNKSEKYLKNSILPKMLSNEKLTKLHQDNHPNRKIYGEKVIYIIL